MVNNGSVANELIKITENDGKSVVSARELHEFLEVKTRFNDWILRRIYQYDLIESVDYISLTQNRVSGGLETEYALSIDAAKELSMVENNEKGKQARRYFINCEKRLKEEAFRIPVSTVIYNLGKPISINSDGYWNMIEMCAVYNKNINGWHGSSAGIAIMCEMNMRGKTNKDLIYSDSYGQWCHPCIVPMFSNWIDHSFSVFCNKQLSPLFKDVEVREYDKFMKYKSVYQYLMNNIMVEPMTKKDLYSDYVKWCEDGINNEVCMRIDDFSKYIKYTDLTIVGNPKDKKLFPIGRKNEISWVY